MMENNNEHEEGKGCAIWFTVIIIAIIATAVVLILV